MARISSRLWWAAGLIVLAGVLMAVFSSQESRRQAVWETSTFNAGGSGHKALFAASRAEGWPVRRFRGDYRELDRMTRSGHVFILARGLLGRHVPMRKADFQSILKWVARGNRLILLGPLHLFTDTDDFLRQAGFHVFQVAQASDLFFEQAAAMQRQQEVEVQYTPTKESPIRKDAKITALAAPEIPAQWAGAKVLWRHRENPAIVQSSYGSGEVTWIASTSVIDNKRILNDGNLAQTLLLIRAWHDPSEHVIWFDETQHGYRTAPDHSKFWTDRGLLLAMGILGLTGSLFLMTGLRRFGPPLQLPQQRYCGSADFIRSLGNLYRQAGLLRETMQFLLEDTRKALRESLNLPGNAPDERIAQRLRRDDIAASNQWSKTAKELSTESGKISLARAVCLAGRMVKLRCRLSANRQTKNP